MAVAISGVGLVYLLLGRNGEGKLTGTCCACTLGMRRLVLSCCDLQSGGPGRAVRVLFDRGYPVSLWALGRLV